MTSHEQYSVAGTTGVNTQSPAEPVGYCHCHHNYCPHCGRRNLPPPQWPNNWRVFPDPYWIGYPTSTGHTNFH